MREKIARIKQKIELKKARGSRGYLNESPLPRQNSALMGKQKSIIPHIFKKMDASVKEGGSISDLSLPGEVSYRQKMHILKPDQDVISKKGTASMQKSQSSAYFNNQATLQESVSPKKLRFPRGVISHPDLDPSKLTQ